MTTSKRKRRRKPHQSPPPPAFDRVRLAGGPLDGKVLLARRADPARLFLRDNDGLVQCIYVGDSASGVLAHERSFVTPAKAHRRRRCVSLAATKEE